MSLAKPSPIPKDGQYSVAWSRKRALPENATPSSVAGLQCETAPAEPDAFHSSDSPGDPVFPISKHSPGKGARDLTLVTAASQSQQFNSPRTALQYSIPSVCLVPPPPAQPCLQDHELLAAEFLQRKDFSAASVLRLIDLLPRVRKVQGRGGSRLCLGAYFRAGVVSLYKNNTPLKHSCQYLCAFIHHVAPRHVFAALDILDEVQSGVHLDRFNVKRSSSLVVPITHFSGGQLWVEDPAGRQPLRDGDIERFGYLRDFAQGPCLFDPHSRHAVKPWDGRRVVIAAYLPMGVDSAGSQLRSQLSGLGFVLRVFPSPEPPPAILDPRCRPSQTVEPSPLSVVSHVVQADDDELLSSFAHLQPHDLLVIELCAGTAILSRTAAAVGLRTMPVDNNPRRAPGKNVLRIDLADPEAVAQLLEIIQHERVALLSCSLRHLVVQPALRASASSSNGLARGSKSQFRSAMPNPLTCCQASDPWTS